MVRRAREAGPGAASWRREGGLGKLCKIEQNVFFSATSILDGRERSLPKC